MKENTDHNKTNERMETINRSLKVIVLLLMLVGFAPSASLALPTVCAAIPMNQATTGDDLEAMRKNLLNALDDFRAHLNWLYNELNNKATEDEVPELYKRSRDLQDMIAYNTELVYRAASLEELKEVEAMFSEIMERLDVLYREIENLFDFTAETADGMKMMFKIISDEEKTVEVKGIGSHEENCTVNIPENVNGYTVIGIGEKAFYESNIGSIDIPNSVVSIGNFAFNGCTSLTSMTIPNSVTTIGDRIFSNCTNLSNISVESGNGTYDSRDNCNAIIETASNTLIAGCKNTVIPNSIVRIGGGAFFFCTSLTSISIPGSVTIIGSNAFVECSSLTSLTIPNSVTTIGEFAFSQCYSLTSVSLPYSLTSIGYNAFGWCNSLTSVTVGMTTPLAIGDFTFTSRARANATLYVPAGCKAAYEAADYWKEFKEIVEIDASGDTNIVFADANVKDICVANWDTNKDGELDYDEAAAVTELEGFGNNREITTFNELQYFTSLENIGKSTFESCMNLTSVTFPNSLKTIASSAFYACYNLASLSIPISVTNINSIAFGYAYNISSITVEPGNTKYDSRDNCNAIIETSTNSLIVGCKETNIPQSVTKIDYGAFAGCTELTSLTIPNSVTSIESIAFYDCKALKSVVIPNSMRNIGNYAFLGCSSLTSVTVGMTTPIMIKEGTFSNRTNAILYVPRGCKAAYEAADYWKEFKEIVELKLDPLDEDDNVDYSDAGSSINEDTNLTGTVVNNMYYNIGTDAGGFSAEDGCIVITKETSDEQMEALEGLGITDEELKQNFTGIIFKVPAGKGKVAVTAETTGNMTLKVKVGNGEPMEMELSGKLKIRVPYNVTEETMVYIFAGTLDENAARGMLRTNGEQSLKIYGIELDIEGVVGDANNDGDVNADDIEEVANAIVGNPSEKYNKAAADMDGNGIVDVLDLTQIVEIVKAKH